jgi:hypothetical protein
MAQSEAPFKDQSNDQAAQFNTTRFLDRLQWLKSASSIETLRCAVADLQEQVRTANSELSVGAEEDWANIARDWVDIDRVYLCDELDQIAASRTLGRAQYYVERLIKGITEVRTSPVNDINLNRWKTYHHIITDSLWTFDRRDSSGAHTAGYWGNFVPQIPHQMLLRYTKRGEWTLDPFAGAGTTLIEGQRLGRNTVGIELQAHVADGARRLVADEPNSFGVVSDIITGDSQTLDYRAILSRHNQKSVQLVIMHPPYFDIIKFSDDARDLSNAADVTGFLEGIATVVERSREVLDRGRYLVLVIGDKYAKGEWIPLGFMTMNEVAQRGFLLKSIVVKNFDETTGKRTQKKLWRYRALAGGFYIFKHEYIFIFKKR